MPHGHAAGDQAVNRLETKRRDVLHDIILLFTGIFLFLFFYLLPT